MKKTIALSAALLIFVSAMVFSPQTALANPDGMVVVYVHVPDDWEAPHLWAWDDAGNGAFSSWPGGEAEADPNNPGWYYCYLPNWAVNIIVNANDGAIQTDALSSDGGDIWITVASPEEAGIAYAALTSGEAPAYVEKITVYARVPADWDAPCLWAWLDPDGANAFAAWPGGEMKAGGEWYSVRAPSWINSVIVNANEGTVQTSDYKDLVQGKDIWVVVADDLTAAIYYENPDLMVPNITVRVQVPADWENPHLWAWLDPDGTNAFASWPGDPFERNGDWYELALPGWVNSLIVNANGGAVQTGDMKGLDVGKDVWIVVTDAETYTYDYAEIASSGTGETAPPPAAASPDRSPAPVDDEPDSGNAVLWIVLGAAAVAAAVIVVAVVAKRKK
ncbi:MAG: starch-binding protein [Oscillospiraceae bacterium]|nr:starch-binding protein [Oscillospiraceae bacterium]